MVSAPVHPSRPTALDVDRTQSIWNYFNLDGGLDLASPGMREFSVELREDRSFIWPFFWCAVDEPTLADNLKSMTVEFMVDGAEVPATDILEYEDKSERWACHYWATNLSGWQGGEQVSLTVKYRFRRTVHDGQREYRAGEYYYKLNVEVSLR
jgi:hypothetical protein